MPYATAKIATITCLTCDTSFHVDRDEDGSAEIPIVICSNIDCSAHLCPDCPQFACDGCGEKFCAEHAVEIEEPVECACTGLAGDYADATWCFVHNNPKFQPRPLKRCAVCAEDQELINLPEETQVPRLEPVSAVVIYHSNIPEWRQGGVA